MKDQAASRTAACIQGRAAADGRLALGVFLRPGRRPVAAPRQLVPVEQVRRGEQPRQHIEHKSHQWVRAVAPVVVPRTVAVDQAVTAAGASQLVVVGAGLDSRAWRLPALASSMVYTVRPSRLARHAEQERSAGLEPVAARLVRVAADLAQVDLASALAPAGHDVQSPTTWVWEGGVPYLTREQVETTTAAIARSSAPAAR